MLTTIVCVKVLNRHQLHWTKGHNWRTFIPVNKLPDVFEYKYVIQDSDTSEVMRWEGGNNRVMSFREIQSFLDNPEIAKDICRTNKYNFNYGLSKMTYLPSEMKIAVLEYWRD